MNIVSQMRELVRDHDEMDNEAFNLWTWLPSHYFAKKAHGDYADAIGQPSNAQIMRETCLLFSYIRNPDKDIKDNLKEAQSWFNCPCDDCYAKPPSESEIREIISRLTSAK